MFIQALLRSETGSRMLSGHSDPGRASSGSTRGVELLQMPFLSRVSHHNSPERLFSYTKEERPHIKRNGLQDIQQVFYRLGGELVANRHICQAILIQELTSDRRTSDVITMTANYREL